MRDQRDLKVWLDEWELPPGRPWQDELEKIIRTVRSAAVLVGKDGLGPWELPEMRGCLSQMVSRNLPVIPVLLPGAPDAPELPLFLSQNTWVDLRGGITEDGLDRLQWGITGTKPPRREERARSLAGPRIHNLPFPPLGDLLKGRDEELRRLEANLQNQATAITQAIHGLGGIGKTRLAVEYAWRSGDRYKAAFFIRADSREALRSGLAALVSPELLNLPERQSKADGAVLSWLREHTDWLVILDNVDTEGAALAVGEVMPLLLGGHVLITSRRREWPPGIQRQPLDTLSLEESTRFLLQRTQEDRIPTSEDTTHAGRLAEILDGLPLALEQAAAYISHNQMAFPEYLEIWSQEREQILSWYDAGVMQYPTSLAVTWQRSFSQLGPTAAAILRLTGFLAPEPIPSEMFEEGSSAVQDAAELFHTETGKENYSQSIKAAIAALAAYSMITRQGKTFIVHRLMQEVLRSQIPDGRKRDWIGHCLQIVNDFAPAEPSDVRTWPKWDLLRPHALQILGHADRAGLTQPAASLMNQVGYFLYAKSLYSEAEPMLRRALEIDEATLGYQNPKVAVRLSNLAQLLQATNRLSEAEPMIRLALEIDEAAFGPTHPRVAKDLNNLALLLRATNRLSEAEPIMRRALEIDEAAFGTTHLNVAIRLNNLASLLKATNRISEAEPMMRRALEIDEAAFGPTHPNVAIRLNNLAQLLQATNRLPEAEPIMRRALEILERSLGVDHPNTQIARHNLELLLNEIASAGSEDQPPE